MSDETLASNPDTTNYEYDDKTVHKVFISYVNSYHSKFIAKNLLSYSISFSKGSKYKIYGTFQESQAAQLSDFEFWTSNSESFLNDVSQCDFIILDISQDNLQLLESKAIVNYLENLLENGTELKFKLILISTILTWGKTAQKDEIVTDSSYRKRRPHPCFNDHLLLERKVMNLQKKYKDSVKSMVVCPGIIYGEQQDIFHYIFKQCYFNHPYVDVFMPGVNYLPIIYIHDFVKIVLDLIINFPDVSSNYILAVQPNPLNEFEIATIFAQSISESEVMIRICEKDEILAMGNDKITQRTYNHMMLNLRLESDYLKNFEFTINGQNLKDYAEQIANEFYSSRKLKPIRIVIDGSPHTYQGKLGKKLSQFYCIHPIDHKCFLKYYQCRLALKVHYIEQYLSYMERMSLRCSQEALETIKYNELISSNENLLENWKQEKQKVDEILLSKNYTFDDISDFLVEKLSCHGCTMHQGYVLSNFQLDSTMASRIFLNNDHFNEKTKPDYVIIINRSAQINENCQDEDTRQEKDQIQQDLTDYYDKHDEEVSILNFFLDRGIVPLEITINHDLNDREIQEIFEKLKLKIGHPHSYELSKEEQDEINEIKSLIADKEAAERKEMERKRAQKEFEENQIKLEEWNKQVMEQKEKEFHKLEQQSLPVRQYLMKYVLPKVTDAFVQVTKLRPEDPVQFIGNYLFQGSFDVNCDSKIDQQIVDEFKSLSKCDPEIKGTGHE
ncbi:adenylate kinase 7-like [Chironomus tepperi]|uniref:adenylate kinase 7-like n=1 Tax=Chironomus tepperi TaxID=113505 RepID=UPI00391F9154